MRARISGAILIALSALCGASQAQDYPAKPVKIIMPFPAGGGFDIVARIVAKGLSDQTGQAFVVENRVGAGGNIGADAVARAAPDGYTIGFLTSGPLANNKLLYKSMSYDADKAFAPIVLVGEIPLVFVAHPSVPVKNLAEYVQFTRDNPGKSSVGHAGNGTIGHLALELLKFNAKANMLAVSYKGEAPALADVLAGAIQATSAPIAAFVPHIQAGKLTPLAIASTSRFPGLPNVATAREQGVDVEASVWAAVVAPAGTPKPILDKLNREVNAILLTQDVREKLEKLGVVAIGGAADKVAERAATDTAKWKRVIDAAHIAIE
ncbi:tripartite tricarboxylate transporter substrate binding protein [Hydrogenophaga sp.]|uniref:Bug family tripartite tricarboxylate transporter substrate binding protein n=1 Tax=Hydrogenophaga sp. TaxID=1904254 RepID=UPI00271E6943|nr:tripartite tricarboxylate transporter substrate binding protein [Hydrogenophaga sp.]MDO9437086.1 tripartite tricarboxylate transporter substrate binding protein [Hydrogenophaga sp.]